MEIISALGELKAFTADISVISSRHVEHAVLCAKVTSSVALSRTAGQTDWMYWNTVVTDRYNCFQPATGARLYCPQTGWYLANVYLQSSTATAHDALLQIHNSFLYSHFTVKKWMLPPGSAQFPTQITLNGVAYVPQGAYFYANWGTSQAISSLTGEVNIGFGIWKLS